MALYNHCPILLCPHVVMALCSYGPIQLWPYVVMALCSNSPISRTAKLLVVPAAHDALAGEARRCPRRRRRRHVHCAGIDVPVLKMTASARAFQRRAARAYILVALYRYGPI